jgi:hypothetical protein
MAALPIGLTIAFALLLERTAAERKLSGTRARALAAGATVVFASLVVLATRVALGTWDFLPLAAACFFWLLPAGKTDPGNGASSLLAKGFTAPLLAGAVTAVSVLWIWGGLRAVPVYHDEAAYILQARIFATGHWTAPGRPLPEFFEQTHVFVTPVLAAKYPPGHSLALVPGVWLGLPGLVPVLSNGLAGALVFLLARRVAGARLALLTWLIWVTAPGALAFRASYLSQSTSTALWLLGWWLLLRWRETGAARHLIALAVCAGGLFLTRPLTMLAFSIPVAVVVVTGVVRRRAWRAFALAVAAGAAVLCVVPLWSYETLGDWRTTPYHRYSRVYYPYQWTGFTFDDTPALRSHPPEMEAFDELFRRIQHEHRISRLPEILKARLAVIGQDVWGGGRRYLFVFAVLGMLGASAELLFAVAGCGVLILAYLVFAHAPFWSVYYMEGHPALAFATACGLLAVLSGISERFTRTPERAAAVARWALAAVCVGGLILPSLPQLWFARASVQQRLEYQTAFRREVEAISDRKMVVFVRYAPGHNPHRELVSNDPDLATSRAWIVYDRGARNEELMRLARGRVAYIYDEVRGSFVSMPNASPSDSPKRTGGPI